MAMSLEDSLRMARACRVAGTTMVVNWPMTWSARARELTVLVDQGTAGRVLEVKYRTGHAGPLGSGVSHAGADQATAPMTAPERAVPWCIG
jgi:predicted dehydrogenase